ncbi:MAG: O-antigen ligase family protein [Gaiellaceae bacterium]
MVRHGVEQGPALRLAAPAIAAGWTVAALFAGGFFVGTVAALALAACSGLALVAAVRGLRRPSPAVLALAFLSAWSGASVLWGGHDVARPVLLAVLYAAVLWLAEQLDRATLLRALRVAIVGIALLALGAYALGVAPTAGGSSSRLEWPITYANGLGLVAATGAILWLTLPAPRRLALPAAALCAVTAGLTYSRSTAVAACVAVVVYAAVTARVPPRAVVAIAAAIVVGALLFGPALWSRFERPVPDTRGAQRLTTLSGHGRAQLWRAAWRAGVSRPVTGVGAGAFRTVAGAHSLELQTFAELGAVGLAALALFLLHGSVVARASGTAAAVFALWLVVASVDWMWQLPACTIPALLALGGTVRPHP